MVTIDQRNDSQSAKRLNQARSNFSVFRRGDFLPEASGFWQIQEGFVRTITWDEMGNIRVLGIWGPGDVVSQAFSCIDPFQIECLSATTLQRLTNLENPTDLLLKHHHQTEALLDIFHCRKMPQRLVKVLLWLAQRFGQLASPGAYLLNLRLTHQHIADLVGTTRVTITRLLKQLEQTNYVTRSRGQWLILSNLEALEGWQVDY